MRPVMICEQCSANPSMDKAPCESGSIYKKGKVCYCCHDCRVECWYEYLLMIDSGEAEQEVIDYYKNKETN